MKIVYELVRSYPVHCYLIALHPSHKEALMKFLKQEYTGEGPCGYYCFIINVFEAATLEGLMVFPRLANEIQNFCDEPSHSIFECGESGLDIGRRVPHIFILREKFDLIAI